MIAMFRTKNTATKWADAYKSWAIWLILLICVLATFRDDFWLMLAQALLGTVGVYYGVRALIRGPLRILGGVFLLLNGFFVGSLIARLFLKITAS